MKMDFSFRISSDQCVSRAVIAEAGAIYVGGSFLHHRSEIELSGVAHYRVEPADDNQWSIHGASLTENLNRLSLAHYLLMAGFFKANFSIEYFGANASWLPEHGRMIPSMSTAVFPVTLPRLFREHLDSQTGNAPLSMAAIEDLYESLIGTDTIKDLSKSATVRFASDSQMLVTFPGDVSVQLAIVKNRIESHSICGFTLGGMTAENGLREHCPKHVRTWGEAWLAHDDSTVSTLSGLLTLPNEVGIVTNRLYRYRIDEQETLTNRDRSYLGEGRSKVYGHVQWIRYAGRYFEMRNKAMVEACLNQAERLSVTKVQLRKIDRMRTEWKLFSLPSGPVRLLAMGAIPSQCGMTVYERIVAVEKTRLEAFEFSDYGRKTWNVTDVSYAESTPNKLMDAGFNEGVFELLTGQSAPQILPEGIPQLFSFDADNRRVWGHNHTGRYFVEVQPNIVFGS